MPDKGPLFPINPTSYEISYAESGYVICVGTYGLLTSAAKSALDFIESYPAAGITLIEVTRKVLISSTSFDATEHLKTLLAPSIKD